MTITIDQQKRIQVNSKIRFVVSVAQLVEHRIVVPVVAGSSPVAHPTLQGGSVAEALRLLLLSRHTGGAS